MGRTVVDQYFSGVQYPATKAEVIALAEKQGAPQRMIDALQRARTESFASIHEVRQVVVRAAEA